MRYKIFLIFFTVILLFSSCQNSVESEICCLKKGDKAEVFRGDKLIPNGEAEILVTHCNLTGKKEITIIDGNTVQLIRAKR